jgi:lysine biosynthesis protein LysW
MSAGHGLFDHGGKKMGTTVVYCPECEARIELREVRDHEIVFCLACGSDLRIVGTDPAQLELVEEDDWLSNDTE